MDSRLSGKFYLGAKCGSGIGQRLRNRGLMIKRGGEILFPVRPGAADDKIVPVSFNGNPVEDQVEFSELSGWISLRGDFQGSAGSPRYTAVGKCCGNRHLLSLLPLSGAPETDVGIDFFPCESVLFDNAAGFGIPHLDSGE